MEAWAAAVVAANSVGKGAHMNVLGELFDDSKLYESIFGETRRWQPGQSSVNERRTSGGDAWNAMANAFKEGADHLVDWVVDGRTGPMSGAFMTYPVMSDYRHYLELSLKGILIDLQEWELLANRLAGKDVGQANPEYNHQLMEVWRRVRKLLYRVDANELATEGVREQSDAKYDAIEDRIKEFDDIDRKATSFRYPVDKNGKPTAGVALGHKEMLQVKNVVAALEFYLSGIGCGVSEAVNEAHEALAFLREMEAEYAWHASNDDPGYI